MKATKILAILVLALGLATEVAHADFTFGEPTNMGPPVNSSSDEWDSTISADGLALYFCSGRPGGLSTKYDIWVTTRNTTEDPWGEPVNLGPTINSSDYEIDPGISSDDLEFYFATDRPGWYGGFDLWMTKRPTKDDPWREPVNLGPTVNSSYDESDPTLSADGLSLYFGDWPTYHWPAGYGNGDIWVTTRTTKEDEWGTPVNIGPVVSTVYGDHSPGISSDDRVLFFNSDRPGGSGSYDLWVTMRKTIDDNWGLPVNLGPNVNSAYSDRNASISADSTILYFDSPRPGGYGATDLWQAPIIPIVDLNSDGIVDAADMVIMVDHWGTDNSLCDIGPMPWGDGIVDVQDLIILAEHLFEEIPPVE